MSRSPARSISALGLLLPLLLAAPLASQEHEREATRFSAGAALLFARGQGDFRAVAEDAFGASAHGRMRIDEAGWLSLRTDLGFAIYGSEEQRVPLSSSVGGRITVDLTTTNSLFYLTVGPHLELPYGPVRPYLTGGLGFVHLVTSSALSGDRSNESFASTRHLGDQAFSKVAAVGLRVPITRGATAVSVDVGAHYQDNSRAAYLGEGDIEDRPDGSIAFTPRRTETELVRFQLGVSIGIPRRR